MVDYNEFTITIMYHNNGVLISSTRQRSPNPFQQNPWHELLIKSNDKFCHTNSIKRSNIWSRFDVI
jgi:hypothetical protein